MKGAKSVDCDMRKVEGVVCDYTHGAGSPARLLSSIAFRSAHQYQNVRKATVGLRVTPSIVMGFVKARSIGVAQSARDSWSDTEVSDSGVVRRLSKSCEREDDAREEGKMLVLFLDAFTRVLLPAEEGYGE